MKAFYILFISLAFLISCNSKDADGTANATSKKDTGAAKHAKAICDCFSKIPFDDDPEEILRELEKMDADDKKKIGNCLTKVGDNIEEDLDGIKGKAERKLYTKSFLKGLIDCDCADKFMGNIPYDDFGKFLKDMKREVKDIRDPEDMVEYPSYPSDTGNAYGGYIEPPVSPY